MNSSEPKSAALDAAAAQAVKPKRQRLSPELRKQQILEAALNEFSAEGFSGASIANIARRAGTSKANIFAHFQSKDEIFETLLQEVLDPAKAQWTPPRLDHNVDAEVDAFIDQRYADLTPRVIAIMRLLITDGHRVPDMIERWHRKTVQPGHDKRQELIQQSVKAGLIKPSPLTENFGFVMAPILYAVIFKMVFPPEIAENETRKIRETHRQLLHLLLRAPD